MKNLFPFKLNEDDLLPKVFEVFDDVGAFFAGWHGNAHPLSWRQFLRVGQPSIEHHFIPNDMSTFEGVGIVEPFGLASGTPKYATMCGTDAVEVWRVAGTATRLIQGLAKFGIPSQHRLRCSA